jgi:hypothetical protein
MVFNIHHSKLSGFMMTKGKLCTISTATNKVSVPMTLAVVRHVQFLSRTNQHQLLLLQQKKSLLGIFETGRGKEK